MSFPEKNTVKHGMLSKRRTALLGSAALLAIVLEAVVINPSTSFAANVIWDGDASGTFTNNANWVGDVLPNGADTAIIAGNGSNAPVVNTNETVNILDLQAGDLTIAGGSNLNALASASVTGGTLSGAGTINTGILTQTGGTISVSTVNADQRITAIGGAITNTGATGVTATNTGAGAVSVVLNAAGGVNNGAGRGVEVTTVDGDITVDGAGSVSGVNGGIVAVTQTGSITISGTGDSTTTGNATAGDRDRAISARILGTTANGSNVVINRSGAIQSNSTGTFNQGILVEHLGQGTGDVTITTGAGGISVSGGSSRGIHVNRDSTATGSGNITIDTRAGAISNTGTAATIGIFGALSSDGSGLFKIDSGAISTSNTTGHGILALVTGDNSDIQVTTHGTITGGTKGVEASNGFDANGVILNSSLSGNVHVTTNAVIGDGTAAGNPAHGIVARGGNGVVEIDANANINADGQAIFAQVVGTGSIDIDTTGQTLTAGSVGIFVADLKTGQLDIVTGAVTGTALNGIEASFGTGVKNITTNGAVVGGQTGIKSIVSTGSGKVTVTANANVTGNGNRGIDIETGSGDIDVLGTGNITGGNQGLVAKAAAGNVHITMTGTVRGINGDGLAGLTTTGNIVIDGNGNVQGNFRAISASSTGGSITISGSGTSSVLNGPSHPSDGVGAISAAITGGVNKDILIDRTGTITKTSARTNRGIHATNDSTGTGKITIDLSGGTGINFGDVIIDGVETTLSAGIYAERKNGTGKVDIDSGAVTVSGSKGFGIEGLGHDGSSVEITNHGTINGGHIGVGGFTFGSGDVTIVTAAEIGDTTAPAASGIHARADGSGNVTVTANNNVTSAGEGIHVDNALNNGTGNATVTGSGTVAGSTRGIDARTTTGAITIGGTGATSASGADSNTIFASTTNGGASNLVINRSAAITNTGSGNTKGIIAQHIGNGAGNLNITTGAGGITVGGNNGMGISAFRDATAAGTGGVNIDTQAGAIIINGTGTAGGNFGHTDGIAATIRSNGTGVVTINAGVITTNNTTGRGIFAYTSADDSDIDVITHGVITGGQVGVEATNGFDDTVNSGFLTARNGTIHVTTNAVIGDGAAVNNLNYGVITRSGNGATEVDVNATIIADFSGVLSVIKGNGSIDIDTSGQNVTGGEIGVRVAELGSGQADIVTGTTTGTTQDGIFVAGTGVKNITTGGATLGDDNGISAVNGTGTGKVTVTANAAVTGTTEDGIVVETGTGDIDVKGTGAVSGNTHGINAETTTGAISVTGTGASSASGNTTNAIRTRMSATTSTANGITINRTGDATTTGTGATRTVNAVRQNAGAGNISVTVGNVTDNNGTNAFGIDTFMENAASSGQVIINSTAGTIDMNGGGTSKGIYAVTDGSGKVDVDSGAIDTNNTTGHGIHAISSFSNATNAAAIEINTFGAITGGAIGIEAAVTNANGAGGTIDITTGGDIGVGGSGSPTTAGIKTASRDGNTLITLGGNVSSAGDGIKSDATGTGTVTITGTGDITGGSDAGDDGIDVTAQGAVSVSVNGTITGDPGIVISSANGPIDVTGTGNVVGNGGDGIKTTITDAGANGAITINRDGTVTGTVTGISAGNLGTGNVNITTAKAVTGGTKAAIAASTQAGLSTITLNAGANVSATSGLAIFNNAGNSTTTVNNGATVAGEITLGDGDDNLTFANGGFNNVTVFDGGDDISVADGFEDVLTLNGAGTVTAANIRNWEQFNIGGALTVNGGGTLGAGTTTINNGGTLNAGNALTLAGKMVIAAGGTFNGTGGGAGVFSSTGNVTNSGSITLADGTPGDVFTVNGDYIGGGSVSLDTELNDGLVDKTDRFDITGDSAGATVLNVNVSGGAGGSTGSGVADGIQVVTVGGTSAGTFTLGNNVSIGAFNYDLVQADGQNWFLQSGTVTNQVATYSAMQSTFQQGMATYRQRLGQRVAGGRSNQAVVSPVAHLFKGEGGTSQSGSGFWMKSGYSDVTAVGGVVAGGVVTKPEFHTRQTTIQIGYDKQLYKAETSKFVMGLFGEYKHTDQTVNNAANSQVSTSKSDAYGGGISATWFNPSGIYADFVGQLAIYDVKITDKVTGSTAKPDVFSYSASTEIGYRIGVTDAVRFVPQAQIMLGSAVVDNFTDSTGVNVKTQNKTRFTGRLGLGLEFTMPGATPDHSFTGYGVASVIHDFSGKYRFTAAGTDIETKINPTRLEGVLGGNWRTGKLRLFGELGVSHSFANKKYVGYKGTAGLEVAF